MKDGIYIISVLVVTLPKSIFSVDVLVFVSTLKLLHPQHGHTHDSIAPSHVGIKEKLHKLPHFGHLYISITPFDRINLTAFPVDNL